jgi:fructosamine-3-kinase
MANRLETEIEHALGVSVKNISSVGGGCIADSRRVELSDGRLCFLKTGEQHKGMFTKEANGLRELRKAKAVRVPEVLYVGDNILLLEYIESVRAVDSRKFFETFGRSYALLHKYHGMHYGFYEDNFIGSTIQKNIPSQSNIRWWEFYYLYRLKFQFDLAISQGYGTDEFKRAFGKLEQRIESIIGNSPEQPALLHGDLWGGNFLSTAHNEVVLIDPAVYYGHREADLAMTRLFGGFSSDFYSAYNEVYPLESGWREREDIYKLYHVLNHLNLFGQSYYSQALSIIRSYR